jgi:hypothetical protein
VFLGFAQMLPPTWRAKDVVGNHGHLWGHRPLCGSAGGRAHCTKSGERSTAR